LMSLFSIYCGFIYNEIFGVPFVFFPTTWDSPLPGDDQYVWKSPETAYWFGVDPTWKFKKNELIFYNSLKMKISIILGVTQMSLGILLSLFNGIHFRKPYNILFEFIPQILFLLSIFGYMCFLILLKWCKPFEPHDAPSLINVLINMFFKILDDPDPELYPAQKYVQWLLIAVAVISVPVMLLVKPILLRRDFKKKKRMEDEQKRIGETVFHSHHHPEHHKVEESEEEKVEGAEPSGDEDSGSDEGEEEEEEFEFSEVFVHQVIHTIEFVLGCVSNTASYLRLWALSLAHSELAFVFWADIMEATLKKKNAAIIFAGFAVWAAITWGVLMVMESLSAFLHALRLHWVEFQNKFYLGDGYAFIPFSYTKLLQEKEEGDQAAKR